MSTLEKEPPKLVDKRQDSRKKNLIGKGIEANKSNALGLMVDPFTQALEALGKPSPADIVKKYTPALVRFGGAAATIGADEFRRMSPKVSSTFIREMTMSLEDRLELCGRQGATPMIVEFLDIGENSVHKGTQVPVDQPLFHASPANVVFQAYNPFQTYEALLSFRNRDGVARRLKVNELDSPFFSLAPMKGSTHNGSRVAPGMEICFLLKFFPETKKDYACQIICSTDREKFVIPVRAIGGRGVLDFPDDVNFSECAVKAKTYKPLLVRNIGSTPARVIIDAMSPFSITPNQTTINVQETLQFELSFFPTTVGSFERDILIQYDTGEKVIVKARGIAEDVMINLEKSSIIMENTYISLASTKTFRLYNKSNIVAYYDWKRFQTDRDDEMYKIKKIKELEDKDQSKMSASSNSIESSIASKRYQNMKREILEDKLLFNDEVIQIEPVQGEIWPNSFIDIHLVFQPKNSILYTRNLYCDISGRQQRLPLTVRGHGIGPMAHFPYDCLDIETVFIHSTHRYEIPLENKGGIDVNYHIIPSNTPFGSKFRFSPSDGIIMFAETQMIEIFFEPNIMGEFYEEFKVSMDGSNELLTLVFRGKVIGPTIETNKDALEFGIISYGFPATESFEFHNNSEISLSYNIRIDSEDSDCISAFEVAHASGHIEPGKSASIEVSVTPMKQKMFQATLLIDIVDVGESFHQLEIIAESVIPRVELKDESIDIGECSLSFPYESQLHLVNQTNLPAKYQIPASEEEKESYKFKTNSPSGIIGANSVVSVPFEVMFKKLGAIQFPIFIQTMGNETKPLEIVVSAFAIGPIVEVSTNKVDFGKVNVLTPVHSSVELFNKSVIMASFLCEMPNESSVFHVEPKSGLLLPGQKISLKISAFVDDNAKFQDSMKIGILNGTITDVVLLARGVGSTICFDENLKRVSFGDIFTNRVFRKEFSMINRGRRTQMLNWLMEDVRGTKDKGSKTANVFTVVPNRFAIPPNEQKTIVIEAYSTVAIENCREMIICQAAVDKDPTKRVVLGTEASATFVKPLVNLSSNKLFFHVERGVNEVFEEMSKQITMKNVSSLPICVSLATASPFVLEPMKDEYVLLPHEEETLTVWFTAKVLESKESYEQVGKIAVSYKDHPHKDYIELRGKISFPNLSISLSKLEFGCIQGGSESRKRFQIKNFSLLPVYYQWSMNGNEWSDPNLPVGSVFDLTPLQGYLLPEEQQEIEAIFIAPAQGKFSVNAYCEVQSGPVYSVQFYGESSSISYDLDTASLDFGRILYLDITEKSFVITNSGTVTFGFRCFLPQNSILRNRILIQPEAGVVAGGSKQKILVKFCPCVPDLIDSFLYVQIAHEEPVKIHVRCQGMFSFIRFSLPVVNSSEYIQFYEQAKERNSLVLKESELEAEAIRLMVKDKVTTILKNSSLQNNLLQSLIDANSKNNNRGGYKSRQNNTESTVDGLSGLSFIDYICDLGNVVRSTIKRKTVKVTNLGPLPVSFIIEKAALNGTNFNIEPDKIRSLPSMESTDLVVSYHAKTIADAARSEIKVPISVANGSSVSVVLKASVAVPDLQVSTSQLEYGELAVGQRKTISFQLVNVNTVPCEWSSSLVYYEGTADMKRRRKTDPNMDDFIITPNEGILQGNDQWEICVQFTPTKSRKYDYELHLKIGLNPKPTIIDISAITYKPFVKIDPVLINLPHVLPYVESTEAKFVIENPTNHPLELYSLDFDKQYKEEEDLLLQIESYENGVFFSAPRILGDGLPIEIIEHIKSHSRATSATSRTGTNYNDSQTIKNDEGQVLSRVPSAFTRNLSLNAKISDVPINIIFHGPALSGKTSQAKKLAETYDLRLINFDSCVEGFLQSKDIVDAPPQLKELGTKISEAITALREGNSELDHKNSYDEAAISVGVQYSACEFPLPEPLVSEIVATRMQMPDVEDGFILDGLDSKYIKRPTFLFKEVVRSMPDRKNSHAVFLDVPKEIILSRKNDKKRLILEAEKQQLLALESLTEEDYENLSEKEKKDYEATLKSLRKTVNEAVTGKKADADIIGEAEVEEDDAQGEDDKKQEKRKKKDKKQRKGPKSPKPSRKNDTNVEQKKELGNSKLDLPETASMIFDEVISSSFETYTKTKQEILDYIREGGEKLKASPILTETKDSSKKGKNIKQSAHHENAQSQSTEPHDPVTKAEEPLLGILEVDGGISESEIFDQVKKLLPPIVETVVEKKTVQFVPKSDILQAYHMPIIKDTEQDNSAKNFSFQLDLANVTDEDGALQTQSSSHSSSAQSSAAKDQTKRRPLSNNKNQSEEFVVTLNDEDKKENRFRWIFKPKEKRVFSVKYMALEIGKVEKIMRFKIVGGKEVFQIKCVGQCEYSYINLDHRKLFPRWRKGREDSSVIQKEYVVASNTFEFGPLSINRPKDKSLDRVQDNRTVFKIHNNSMMPVKVNFCFRYDNKNDMFLLDPSSMELIPGAEQDLNVWLYPKSAGKFDDALLILVKDNPSVFFIRLNCFGVKPELEVDKKTIQFERLLLQRTDQRELRIRNPTIMSAGWKLVGVELLGEEFQISPVEGAIEYGKEAIVIIKFTAIKPIVIKRALRLEVYDLERIGNPVQSDNIVITAEAYDISVDVHFPKSSEGGLDFGVLKVFDETKQVLTLKNKGKYETGFKFAFEGKDLSDFFSISPFSGVLVPSDKTYNIQVVFKAVKEILLRDNLQLKCLITEPSTSETIASIPIRINAKSVFSKFSILPSRELNFGSLVYGAKGNRQIVIENLGEFDFKFVLSKGIQSETELPRSYSKQKFGSGPFFRSSRVSRQTSNSPPPIRNQTKKEIKENQVSPFSISPLAGNISPGSKQIINVEFHPENPGSYDELLNIEISDKGPSQLDGNEYRLIGECCMPGINTTEYTSIFEENSVRKRIEAFTNQSFVYVEDEKIFYFGAFLVGHVAQTRFKVSNPFKVPCEVTVMVRPKNKNKSEASEFAFEVEPKKMLLPSHEYRFVTVIFHPTAIQTYQGLFEAIVENVPDSRTKSLAFEIRGEGTLPRIVVEKPSAKSKSGYNLLRFRRTLVGHYQTLPLCIKNEGIIPAKVKFDWLSLELADFDLDLLHHAVSMAPQEIRTFNIRFKPSSPKKHDCEIRMKVVDNSFEDTILQVQAEGYMEDVSFEGLPAEGDNELVLDDCFVDQSRTVSFFLRNNTTSHVRFQWNTNNDMIFKPTIGHIKPREMKQVSLAVTPKQPCKLSLTTTCITSRFKYTANVAPEFDWDDLRASQRMASAGKSDGQRKALENANEPPIQVFEGSNFQMPFSVSLTADYTEFELDENVISFKTTLMYQTRSYGFPLRNTGKIVMHYNWEIVEDGDISDGESPFSVTPKQGIINPGDATQINVRFHPTDVGNYRRSLVIHVQNVQKSKNIPSIELKGSSLRPFCHFELETKDYLLAERRSLESLTGSTTLDPSTRVIEIESIGTKSKITKKFYILNPTNITYDFDWICESNADKKQILRCLTSHGTIIGGKKFEIVFEYSPETIDVVESFWKFNISAHNILIPFMFLCRALEPNVYFDRTSHNFKAILVNCSAKEIVRLINQEQMPFYFSFDENSEDGSVMQLEPSSGVIQPKSEISITLSFTPNSEKVYNYNLVCNIRKKPTPIVLNVKGEGYTTHTEVTLENQNGTLCQLDFGTTNSNNLVEFGNVYVNEKAVRRVHITNSGRFACDFIWKLKGSNVVIVPEIGSVGKGETLVCELQFCPITTHSLKSNAATLQILNGKTYRIQFDGKGTRPNVVFSELSHDFGPSFVFRPGMKPLEHRFKVTNKDQREISLDSALSNTTAFELQCIGPPSLIPGASMIMSVFFYPREVARYDDELMVDVNGLVKVRLQLQGEGTEMGLELASPDLKSIAFGAVRVGHVVTKIVKLLNRGVVPLKFNIGPPTIIETLSKRFVTFSQTSDVIIRPKGSFNLELKFSPSQRVQPFIEEVVFECPGYTRSLFSVHGACHGIEVRLENESIAFGAVVQRSSANRRIQLQNIGDIGVKFKWDVAQFLPDFSISPPEGYISSGMEIPLDIMFHPKQIDHDIRYEMLPCYIEGFNPLYLSLSGMCVPPAVQNEVIKFSVPVRETETKTFPLSNKLSYTWLVKPAVDNEFWKCPEVLEIEMGQTKSLEISYTPLEMTQEGVKHEGSIFIPMPDGTGMLIKMIGTADKPQPGGTITREIPCKTQHFENLNVKNWLKKPQRLKVIMEQAKIDLSVILKGHAYIDIPPLGLKDYKLSFFAFKEGSYNIKVTFKNEQTQEYLYYVLNFKSTAPVVSNVIELSTISRQPVQKEISIMNPLPISVSFTTNCNQPDITVPPLFTVPPRSEVTCPIEFLPLQAKEASTRLTVTSNELGVYLYDLKLVATPAGPERSIHFKVGLGGSQIQTFRFISYARVKTEYLCRIDSPDFTVEKTVTAAPALTTGGVEVCVDITYEPSRLGDSRSYLGLTSNTGGDYVCPLIGHCIPPKPQGPFMFKPGVAVSIPFKNVTSQSSNFTFVIDNPNFIVKNLETIGGKKTVHINVQYKVINPKAPRTAKMVVTQQGGNATWIYYLKCQ